MRGDRKPRTQRERIFSPSFYCTGKRRDHPPTGTQTFEREGDRATQSPKRKKNFKNKIKKKDRDPSQRVDPKWKSPQVVNLNGFILTWLVLFCFRLAQPSMVIALIPDLALGHDKERERLGELVSKAFSVCCLPVFVLPKTDMGLGPLIYSSFPSPRIRFSLSLHHYHQNEKRKYRPLLLLLLLLVTILLRSSSSFYYDQTIYREQPFSALSPHHIQIKLPYTFTNFVFIFFFFFFNFLFYFPGELYEGQTKWSIEMKTVWISGIFLHLETPTRQNKSGHLSLGWVLWWPINQMCNWPHYIACQCTLLLLHAFIHCA